MRKVKSFVTKSRFVRVRGCLHSVLRLSLRDVRTIRRSEVSRWRALQVYRKWYRVGLERGIAAKILSLRADIRNNVTGKNGEDPAVWLANYKRFMGSHFTVLQYLFEVPDSFLCSLLGGDYVRGTYLLREEYFRFKIAEGVLGL